MIALATSSVLAAAAGLNVWVVLLVVSGLAHFGRRVHLVPEFQALADGSMVVLFAVLLGLELMFGRLPAVERRIGAWPWLLRPTGGAIVFAATPNPIAAAALPLGLVVGALLALATYALGKVARAALVPSMRGLAGVFVGIVATAVATVLAPLALLVPLPAAVLAGGASLLFVWELLLTPRLRRRLRKGQGAKTEGRKGATAPEA